MTLSAQRPPPGPSRALVWRMFDRIAPRYDLLNHLLSAGQDWRWRRRAADCVRAANPAVVLDLATGTGDQLLALARRCPAARHLLGVDLAPQMLVRAVPKLARAGLARCALVAQADALRLPLADATVDALTISFGIRNLSDLAGGLAEMRRVLRPGGSAVILEFSLPPGRVVRAGYLLYCRHVLPRVGAWISGDAHAYRYLNETVETFPSGAAFVALLAAAGFVRARAEPLTCGIVTLYQAEAPPA